MRGALESTPKICQIQIFFTFEFRQIRLKEQCVLIYTLSNVVRIVQQIASTTTFGLCLNIQNCFLRYSPTSTPSSPLSRADR